MLVKVPRQSRFHPLPQRCSCYYKQKQKTHTVSHMRIHGGRWKLVPPSSTTTIVGRHFPWKWRPTGVSSFSFISCHYLHAYCIWYTTWTKKVLLFSFLSDYIIIASRKDWRKKILLQTVRFALTGFLSKTENRVGREGVTYRYRDNETPVPRSTPPPPPYLFTVPGTGAPVSRCLGTGM